MITALCDATIFTGEAMVEGHALLIQNGKIVDIVAQNKVPADAQKVSYGDHILAAGFIDLQVNGGGNILFNNRPDTDACLKIAAAHRHYGTTHLLPTCITDRPEVTRQAITAMRAARKKDPSILGIHIEGPHLGMERRGVHKPDYLRRLSEEDLKLYRPETDEVMLMTVAPETVGPEQIKALRQQGVIVSLGHTNAMPEQIHTALAAGATCFTHLFNGMGGMSARGGTPAEVALDDRNSWCSLIADGYHVSAEMIRLALRAKPKGKVFLVSDAMPPAATGIVFPPPRGEGQGGGREAGSNSSDSEIQHQASPPLPQPLPQGEGSTLAHTAKSFKLYDEEIHVANGRCVNKEGKLAGSAITLADAVRHCVQHAGVELEEALRMASTYPAEFLGLGKRFGRLLPGYEAAIITMNNDLNAAPISV